MSFIFYGWWDWRFLILLAFASFTDYFVGIWLSNAITARGRKYIISISICVNLSILAFFKYFNFFADTFVNAFGSVGVHIEPRTLNIVLPVGISFYTFQTMSYTIDVYRKKMPATKDILQFFAFVSFFPQLVAGPIERASHMLPQYAVPRIFDFSKAKDGLRQMLGGFAKKIIIADGCATLVNAIFTNYKHLPASSLVLGAFYFCIQIYCDFSGYSDIAIGSARLFGFDLMRNFNCPYLSRDIAEFWRKWHISLSTWFRDYLYIPIGGSKGSAWQKVRNVFIIFIVSGFWHGPNWTFIFWGALNAVYFLPLLLSNKNRGHLDVAAHNRLLPSFRELTGIVFTFSLTTFAWIFFRSASIHDAFLYIGRMFSPSIMSRSAYFSPKYLLLIALLFIAEWLQRDKPHILYFENVKSPVIRWATYYAIVIGIFFLGSAQQSFIYFQF
ncbi:MAG TPA: MBOAT family O-acyltransferase [Chitinophagaceae bacterium]|nr:MBOAT family O-acyltransferase [Chitinophagaceae bacterium]